MTADTRSAGGPEEPPPLDDASARRTALALMNMALALLDRAGDSLAAARLQHAIDTVARDEPRPADKSWAEGPIGSAEN